MPSQANKERTSEHTTHSDKGRSGEHLTAYWLVIRVCLCSVCVCMCVPHTCSPLVCVFLHSTPSSQAPLGCWSLAADRVTLAGMSVISKCLRAFSLYLCLTTLLVSGGIIRHSKLHRIQDSTTNHPAHVVEDHQDETPTTQLLETVPNPLPSLLHSHEILLPSHLTDSSSHHPLLSRRTTLRTFTKEPFLQQPWPYTRSSPPCNTYARQDNCVNTPPLSPNPLPPCGQHVAAAPNTTVFSIIGDYGLDGNCEALVHELVMKLQAQFGTLSFIMTTGDNAYWVSRFHTIITVSRSEMMDDG